MESFSPSYEIKEVQFNSDFSDLDNDYMMQWNIESCFGNGNIF